MENKQLHVLENDALIINGVRIVGTALWSAIPDQQTCDGARRMGKDPTQTVETCMNDYHLIYVSESDAPLSKKVLGRPRDLIDLVTSDTRKARVRDTNVWHEEAVRFLEKEARAATDAQVNLLVLTHHTPSFRGTSDPSFSAEPSGMSSAFSSDLEHMLQDPGMAAINTWCFGHTHYNSDQLISGVRLVSNQRGYVDRIARRYRRDLVIEISSRWASRQVSKDPEAAAARAVSPRMQMEV